MLRYVADRIGAAPDEFALYARREETRRDHMARLMIYLDKRSAIGGNSSGDHVRRRCCDSQFDCRRVSRMRSSSAGDRAIARRRAEKNLIEDIPLDRLQSLDRLLEVDPSIGQTRFHWLRSAPEAPAASNLVGLTERIAFLRRLEIDPELRARVSSGRWDQMIREGNATPAFATALSIASVGEDETVSA